MPIRLSSTFHLRYYFLKNGLITFFWCTASLGRYPCTVKIWIWLNHPKGHFKISERSNLAPFYAPGDDSPHGGILLLLCPYVRTYVRTYVRVWLKFLVKVLYWFKLYLMPSKHFRWTVYMLNFDIRINLDEFYF